MNSSREPASFGIGGVLARLRAEFPDISTSKIRFLEAEGLIEPARSRSGYRQFALADVERLRYILTAQRDEYLPLRVIKERLDAIDASAQTSARPTLAASLAGAAAADEASRRGVDLLAMHAWSDVEVLDISGLDWSSLEGGAERSLAESLAGWQERYPDVQVHRLIVRDRPARQLVEKSESAQLVVVGSHGRGGLTAMLGSVSNSVLHAVRMPLIVARPS